MNKILVHINYFEQGQSLERACRLTRELGGDGIEFRRKPGSFTGSDLDYLDEISAVLDKYPLEWISFGAPGVDLMVADLAQREKEIQDAEKFYRKAASRFPLRIVNTFTGNLASPSHSYLEYWHHGSAIATDAQWEGAIAGFQRLGVLAEELGFRFAFETHGVYLHDTIEAALRLVRGVNSRHVGVLWDHLNLMLFPKSPTFEEVIQATGEHLFYVHLKNMLVPPSHFVAISSLSGGILDIRDQLAKLRKAGYAGPICLECPRAGDREQFLREDLAYFRGLLEDDAK
ncbi:MAG: sugar phosphate isomerase/epimerase family protein [Terrimicrobiaceae bacterium]